MGRKNDGEHDGWPSDRGRGPRHVWLRDEKGRKYREEAGARAYETQEDRDSALADRYTTRPCRPECCGSMLASVSAHIDELIPQYMAWCREHGEPEPYDSETLHRWEVERFGDRLYRSTHGVILYAVKTARFGEPRPRKPQPKLTPGLSDAQRKDRMLTALSKNTDDKAMPEVKPAFR